MKKKPDVIRFINITDTVRLAKETHPELSKKIKKLNEKKN